MNPFTWLHHGISPRQHDLADVLLKLVTVVALIPSALHAARQYIAGLKAPFRARQLDFYLQSCEAAGVLANYSHNTDQWETAEKRFWVMYWGPMAVVEDTNVSKAMVDFGTALNESAPEQDLRRLSLSLATACRNSVSQSWNISMGRQAIRPEPENPKEKMYYV